MSDGRLMPSSTKEPSSGGVSVLGLSLDSVAQQIRAPSNSLLYSVGGASDEMSRCGTNSPWVFRNGYCVELIRTEWLLPRRYLIQQAEIAKTDLTRSIDVMIGSYDERLHDASRSENSASKRRAQSSERRRCQSVSGNGPWSRRRYRRNARGRRHVMCPVTTWQPFGEFCCDLSRRKA